MSNRPGGELAKRPLQFIWLCDCSGSMSGKKIESLNFAINEAIPAMRQVADDNPNVRVQVRAITFSSGAKWHVENPTDVQSFAWSPVTAWGATDMGRAVDLACDALEIDKMPERGLPPVLVLISDGQPTDNFNSALERLVRIPWGAKSVRVGIAIGDDADISVLQQFMGGDAREIQPLVATNAQDLVKFIRWASTVPLSAASRPASRPEGSTSDSHVPIPPAPQPSNDPINPTDVF
jgi:uncharacterized protein YegL